MPRRRPRARPLPIARRVEEGPDGYDYDVAPVAGARAVKTYRCPGCDQEIPAGTPHVVVCRSDGQQDHRHWHTPCWTHRANRRPTRKRL
ncbi:MAG: hypothetical protein EBU23_01800 [Mycobacteriaceae bacterium]|nr:hypothetical protein [Mycobacterium sp.]NBQ41335.1 hypothetical protein [Mycobacteriaceae bacterium]